MFLVRRLDDKSFRFTVSSAAIAKIILDEVQVDFPWVHVSFSLPPDQETSAPPRLLPAGSPRPQQSLPGAPAIPGSASVPPSIVTAQRLPMNRLAGGAKVSRLRPGLKFRTLILQKYNLPVTPLYVNSTPTSLGSPIWVSFISYVAKPSACIVKLTLDYFFTGGTNFSVTHYQGNFFLAHVSSDLVRQEILQRPPLAPPGIVLIISKSHPLARQRQANYHDAHGHAFPAASTSRAWPIPATKLGNQVCSILGLPAV